MTVVAATLGNAVSFGGTSPVALDVDEDKEARVDGAGSDTAAVPNVPVAEFVGRLGSEVKPLLGPGPRRQLDRLRGRPRRRAHLRRLQNRGRPADLLPRPSRGAAGPRGARQRDRRADGCRSTQPPNTWPPWWSCPTAASGLLQGRVRDPLGQVHQSASRSARRRRAVERGADPRGPRRAAAHHRLVRQSDAADHQLFLPRL